MGARVVKGTKYGVYNRAFTFEGSFDKELDNEDIGMNFFVFTTSFLLLLFFFYFIFFFIFFLSLLFIYVVAYLPCLPCMLSCHVVTNAPEESKVVGKDCKQT